MKVVFDPPERVFEGTPLWLMIEEVQEHPDSGQWQLQLKPFGRISLHCHSHQGTCRGQWTIPQEGEYQLSLHRIVEGRPSGPVWQQKIMVEKAGVLNFGQEMGIFLPLLIIFFMGTILWVRKHHRQQEHQHQCKR